MTNRKPPSRHGSIYVLVLIVSIIVTLIGILAHRMVQSQARVARLHAQRDKAAALAESAVQWGVHLVTLRDGWRSSITSGAVIHTTDLGEGRISVTITDTGDGDLADDETDEFVITGTGTIGDAVQTYNVTLSSPVGEVHPALAESLTVGATLSVNTNVLSLESGGTAMKQQTLSGGALAPPLVSTADPVDMPASSLVATWAAKGTLIPASTHGGRIESAIFSKSVAPFGVTPDPDGIYVIDAEGSNVDIVSCTVTGTLVVINLGSAMLKVETSQFVFGDQGGPTLISDGDTELRIGFSSGVSQGIFYIDGNLTVTDFLMLVGTLLVTGNADINTTFMSINDHPSAVAGPPEGFTVIESLRVVSGSWERVVN